MIKKFLAVIALAAVTFSVAGQTNLRLMSYNIRNGMGMDNQRDLSRTASVIIATNADIVAIQEVDSMTARSGRIDIAGMLGAKTNMQYQYSPAIDYDGGKYGIGLLSKEKPIKVKHLALPGREEERTALIAEFKNYVVCATHFSLTPEDQLQSVKIICAEAAKMTDKPLFFMGDLNAHPDSEVIKALGKHFTILSDTTKATYPANKPNETIDYIMGTTRPDTKYLVRHTEVMNAPSESDHRPILADLKIIKR